MSNKVVINGVEIEAPDGASISVVNGQVTVNGQNRGSVGSGKIVIETESRFSLHCDQNVEVRGNVSNGVVAKGNVIAENVTGGIEANGNVVAVNVTGGIEAQGDVTCTGNVSGGIQARRVLK